MCPPGVDQTERTDQRWAFLALGVRKKIVFDSLRERLLSRVGPAAWLFNHSLPMDMWSNLARPAPPTASPAATARLPGPPPIGPLSRLERLPSELLHAVMGASGLQPSEVVAVGLASPTLWPHAVHVARTAARAAAAPLAGAELACIGNYLLSLPGPFIREGCISVDENTWQPISRGKKSTYGMAPARTWNYAARYDYNALERRPCDAWADAWDRWAGPARDALGAALAGRLAADLADAASAPGCAPADVESRWVLRNLDAGAYVRCQPGRERRAWISPLAERAMGPGERNLFYDEAGLQPGTRRPGVVEGSGEALGVNDVLLLRTCWTRPRESVETGPNGPCRDMLLGQWAGHRFDIVPAGEGVTGPGWTDCTDEVVRLAEEIADELAEWRATPGNRSR